MRIELTEHPDGCICPEHRGPKPVDVAQTELVALTAFGVPHYLELLDHPTMTNQQLERVVDAASRWLPPATLELRRRRDDRK